MLFCTSLIALVGAADQPQSSPRKLQIVNTKVRISIYYLIVVEGAEPVRAAAIHDMRTIIPLFDSRRQA